MIIFSPFRKTETEPMNPLKFVYQIFILITLLSSNVYTAPSQSINACKETHCVAVVNAGSTGSRLIIYSYQLDKDNTPFNIQKVFSNKIEPGLAMLAPTSDKLNTYLSSLFSLNPTFEIPVYVYGTAGMRLISAPQQQTYYQIIREWFQAHPLWKLEKARTISGVEEGMFGWIAANYSLGNFSEENNQYAGVIDFGGASVQIAFPITDKNNIFKENQVLINIHKKTINLFVNSFLGLGNIETLHQFLNEPACFSSNYPLPNLEEGNGDSPQCQEKISHLINDVHHVNQKISSLLTRNHTYQWYAIGGLPAFTHDIADFKNKQSVNIKDLSNYTNDMDCHQSWGSLQSEFSADPYLYRRCYEGAYFASLLVDGYGFDGNQSIQFLPDGDDWTLGVIFSSNVTSTK